MTPEEKKQRRLETCRRYREKNREKTREANRRWREGNGKGYHKKWKEENKERVTENRRRWEEKNREKVNARHRVENMTPEKHEHRRIYMRDYQRRISALKPRKIRVYKKKILSKEEILIRKIRQKDRNKKYATENRKKISDNAMIRYHNNPHHKIAMNLRTRIRCALHRGKAKKTSKMKDLLGCTIEQFIEYLRSLFKPGMTMELLMSGKIHIDHIRPCAYFDLTKPDQQRICFHYTNMKPEWAEINWSKGARRLG